MSKKNQEPEEPRTERYRTDTIEEAIELLENNADLELKFDERTAEFLDNDTELDLEPEDVRNNVRYLDGPGGYPTIGCKVGEDYLKILNHRYEKPTRKNSTNVLEQKSRTEYMENLSKGLRSYQMGKAYLEELGAIEDMSEPIKPTDLGEEMLCLARIIEEVKYEEVYVEPETR